MECLGDLPADVIGDDARHSIVHDNNALSPVICALASMKGGFRMSFEIEVEGVAVDDDVTKEISVSVPQGTLQDCLVRFAVATPRVSSGLQLKEES